MSSLAPTKRDHPTNSLPSRTGLAAWFQPYLTSTVGQKVLVAVTGSMLIGFVVAHMLGNLQVFAGRDKLNEYAKTLKSFGPLLWVMRGGLLTVFLVHILLALSLKKRSIDARPIRYVYDNVIQATLASRTMVQTGLLIFLFVLYHLAHFTLGWTQTADGTNFLALHDDKGLHDVYAMVIAGFSNPLVSAIYLAAQAVLFLHLSHGIASVAQTLGLNTPRTAGAWRCAGLTIAGLIFIGNASIVVAVWTGLVR